MKQIMNGTSTKEISSNGIFEREATEGARIKLRLHRLADEVSEAQRNEPIAYKRIWLAKLEGEVLKAADTLDLMLPFDIERYERGVRAEISRISDKGAFGPFMTKTPLVALSDENPLADLQPVLLRGIMVMEEVCKNHTGRARREKAWVQGDELKALFGRLQDIKTEVDGGKLTQEQSIERAQELADIGVRLAQINLEIKRI